MELLLWIVAKLIFVLFVVQGLCFHYEMILHWGLLNMDIIYF